MLPSTRTKFSTGVMSANKKDHFVNVHSCWNQNVEFLFYAGTKNKKVLLDVGKQINFEGHLFYHSKNLLDLTY